MKYIGYILQVWYSELQLVRHSTGLILFALIVPLLYPLVYSSVYTNEVVRDVPIAVVDECHSKLSREFARKVDATSEVEVMYHCDISQAKHLMKEEKIYGILHIPSTFERDLARGKQSVVAVYSDMRCMLYYKAQLIAASNVSLDMNADLKVERYIKGSTDRMEEIIKAPVTNDYVSFYNTQGGMGSFIIPAVLMLIIQQLLFISIGRSMGKIRENNSGIGIIVENINYRNALCIVMGKMLFYGPLFMLIGVYMYSFITWLFAFPSIGDYSQFLLFIVPYVLACTFMGITFSSLIYRTQDALLLFVFMSLPLLFLSGMSWPVAAEPKFWKLVSYVFPSTFGAHGYARIMGDGATIKEIAFEFKGLWIQCGVYFLSAIMVYRHELNRFSVSSERNSTIEIE